MKKIWIIAVILGLAVGIYFTTGFDADSTLHVNPKKRYTPEEIWARRLERKRQQKALGITKFDHPNQYGEYHRLIRTGAGDYTSVYPGNYKLIELSKASHRLAVRRSSSRTQAVQWVERGPFNVPGRTRALLVQPGDPQGNSWIAGAVGGGIWKTTDAGQSWENKTPDLSNIAVTTLAQATANPDIIYAGTGESFASDGIDGDGIFKSTDGGDTWTQLASTANTEDFGNVNRVVVDPDNPDLVLAATVNSAISGNFRSGIYRSFDGGVSWTQVYQGVASVEQIVDTPGNFNVLYATENGVGVIKSTDAGQSWENASNGLAPSGRLELAVSPTNTQRLFASVEGTLSGNGSDLYISDNAGATWSLVLEENNGVNFDFLGGQGSYDNTIVVHPYNEDIVYFGGVDLWKVTMKPGTITGNPTVTSVDEEGTRSFMNLISVGGDFFGGRIDRESVDLPDLVSVEVRFGPGLSQKAHRFTVSGRGAGVPDNGYIYRDYVDVPFQVWDIDNNRQLMVSFRDQQEDGVFNLITENTSGNPANHSREYLFIHKVDYSNTPDGNIAVNGGINRGQQHQAMYFFWPVLSGGAVWNSDNLPPSVFRINFGSIETRLRETEIVTDAYNARGGKNSFSQSFGLDFQIGVHPDHHGLYTFKIDESQETFKLITVNDGGVHESNISTDPAVNDGDFTFAGYGYNTSQFYGIDKKPGVDEYIGGMQDNGTWRSPTGQNATSTTKYIRQLGGDGFETVWNNADPNKIIGGSQFNGLARSIDGGLSWVVATSGMTDVGAGNAPFITKIANSKSNPDVLYAIGATGVWVSDDFGGRWEVTPLTNNFNLRSTSDVKVSIANNRIVWAGTGMTSVNRLHVSIDGGISFSVTNNLNNAPIGLLSGLATHPEEDSTAYALFSIADAPKVIKTTDLGQTWEDITGFDGGDESSKGFPDVAVYSLLVLPHETNTIWVGTDIGIVESKDNGGTWNLLNDNLPGTSVWDMKVQDDQVVIATHGRGIWTTTIPDLPAVTFVPFIENTGFNALGKLNVDVSLRSPYDSTQILIDDERVGSIGATAVDNVIFTVDNLPANGTVSVIARSFLSGKAYLSNEKSLQLSAIEPPATSYGNDFNDGNDSDFTGNGFNIGTADGFFNAAINSPHDYDANTQYIYQLNVPIVIAQENARFQYDDVAIIETGETGAVFPEREFYDYVVVEGTKDGLNWIPIADGYDASLSSLWLNRYQNDTDNDGDPGLFFAHDIDLLDKFNPNDTVIFRFRLFSDPVTVGWGWLIDNLFIQQEKPNIGPVGIEDEANTQGLSFISFPNPSLGPATVNYFLPESDVVHFKLIDATGKVVEARYLGRKMAGNNSVAFDFTSQGQGIYFLLLETNHGKYSQKLVLGN